MDQLSFSSLKQMSAELRSINSLLKSENKVLTQPRELEPGCSYNRFATAVIAGRVL